MTPDRDALRDARLILDEALKLARFPGHAVEISYEMLTTLRAALAAEPPALDVMDVDVTHNPKPDWTVTHQRSTTCPFCSEAAALDAHHEIGSQPETCNWCRQYARLAAEERRYAKEYDDNEGAGWPPQDS